ncbi:MAG: hypothetical protein IKW83_01560 [Muribaculaceae bacterium]|nr:hypothetical protein [Muribaculaceae bacterium]
MIILNNTYFGKYASLPMGWLLMACLIAIEVIVMSQILDRKYFKSRVAFTALVSNVVSGIAGAYTSIAINGGRLLTVWFPWVSSDEVNLSNDEDLFSFVLYYAVALVATILIELIVNCVFLKKRYEFRPVMRATIIANVVSFLLGSFVLYSYSFFFYD